MAASSGIPQKQKWFTSKTVPLYIMILPVLLGTIIFRYLPMPGVLIAFTDWRISGFQEWVGFENFRFLFNLKFFWLAFRNTWMYILLNYMFGFPAPIILALLLNELRLKTYKKTIQTMTIMPHFVNWVVIGGVFIALLSPTTGYVNDIIRFFGGKPIYFFSKPNIFPPLFQGMRMWKTVGYSAIIYLAALSGIDEELYEAAVIDGAGRLSQTWHVTLPGMKMTIIVLFVLSFGRVMQGQFEPMYVLQNNMINSVAEVLDTYIYKVGLVRGKYDLGAAAGLFKNMIGMVLLLGANYLSKKITDDKRSIL
jgi:putative aldouronate transport system permease protein